MPPRTLKWTVAWEGMGDAVVWVDVAKADDAWKGDDLYISKGAPDHRGKYDRFGEWLLESVVPVEMPHVSFSGDFLHFTNGRHRFAWLRDKGVRAIPLTVDPREAGRMRKLLGTGRRASVLSA